MASYRCSREWCWPPTTIVLGMGSGGRQGYLPGALGWEPPKSPGVGSCLGGALVLSKQY